MNRQQLEMERTSLARIKQTEIFKNHPPLVNVAAAQRVTLHWTARRCFYTRLKLFQHTETEATNEPFQ